METCIVCLIFGPCTPRLYLTTITTMLTKKSFASLSRLSNMEIPNTSIKFVLALREDLNQYLLEIFLTVTSLESIWLDIVCLFRGLSARKGRPLTP